MSDLMVLDMGELALPFDQTQAAELTKSMTAGLGGTFKRAARLVMSNTGLWELIDGDSEVFDLGNQGVNIVIVDQRELVSRVHYAQSYDEQVKAKEFSPPDCQSYDGKTPDESVENPYNETCQGCPAQNCGYYRRLVAVLVNPDGTFSDPFVFEPKALSLWNDKIIKGRYGSYKQYMNALVSNMRNGVPMPIPTQAVVTHVEADPKPEKGPTMKFGIAPTSNGGYWTLSKEQMDEILALKDSKEVQDMLKPFDAANSNPSSAGRIPVKDVTEETSQAKSVPDETTDVTEEKTAKPAPAKKAAPVKKAAPAPKAKPKKTVVLGMDHPDVKNSEDYDYAELVEWANEADPADVTEFLQDNFPQALEPVEVEDETPAEEPKKKAPVRKAPVKKQAVEKSEDNVVNPSGEPVSPELKQKAKQLADGLDDFDD